MSSQSVKRIHSVLLNILKIRLDMRPKELSVGRNPVTFVYMAFYYGNMYFKTCHVVLYSAINDQICIYCSVFQLSYKLTY